MRSRDGALSPYAAGAGLGILQWVAFATAKKPLGVSTPFETTAAAMAQEVAPGVSHVAAYLKERGEEPALDWEWMLAAGAGLGGYLAARAEGTRVEAQVPALWRQRFGGGWGRRAAGAFVGGALMMFGARMAKGCTSGHCISGTTQLAASSWLFSAVMGLTSVAVARALHGAER